MTFFTLLVLFVLYFCKKRDAIWSLCGFLKFYVQYRFRQREAIFEYFRKETEKCNATLKDLEKQQIDIDDDEDDLGVLRDYLVVYNVSSEPKCHGHRKVGQRVTTSGSELKAGTGGVL